MKKKRCIWSVGSPAGCGEWRGDSSHPGGARSPFRLGQGLSCCGFFLFRAFCGLLSCFFFRGFCLRFSCWFSRWVSYTSLDGASCRLFCGLSCWRTGSRIAGCLFLTALLSGCAPKSAQTATPGALFHFTGEPGWIGGPAGWVYAEGVYHLFYEYNPSAETYGNIHWGHAESRDLLEWTIQPVALSPDSLGYLGAGSVVADPNRTSGLGEATDIPFLAYYTYANPALTQTIGRAYSTDKGRVWTKLPPVVLPEAKEARGADPERPHAPALLRNPHVSWNAQTGCWLMTVSSGSSVLFYTSPDGRQWRYASTFKAGAATEGTNWEGSDFFPLRVEGDGITKWVLTVNMGNGPAGGSPATRYFIGDFDRVAFRATDTKALWLDYGKDNYAGQTVNGLPAENRLWLGWMNNWEYANLFPPAGPQGKMTFPRRLKLMREGHHYLLASVPLDGLEAYRRETFPLSSATLSDGHSVTGRFPFPGASFAVRLTFDNRDNRAIWKAADYGIRLKTACGKMLTAGYRNELSYYYIDRSGWCIPPDADRLNEVAATGGGEEGLVAADGFDEPMGAPYRWEGDESDWYLLFDKNSVEFFAAGGRVALTARYAWDEPFCSFELFARSGEAILTNASIVRLEK